MLGVPIKVGFTVENVYGFRVSGRLISTAYMRRPLFCPFVPVTLMTALLVTSTALARAQEKTTFVDHVLPLVEQHCAKCHNPDKKKGDLDLTSYSGALKGGGSGVAVVAGNVDSSKLIKSVTHAEEPNMPPNKPPLPEKELVVFKKWIAGGLLETSGSKAVCLAACSALPRASRI